MKVWLFLLVLNCSIFLVLCECSSYIRCDKCIQDASCHWCPAHNHSGSRCSKNVTTDKWCSEEPINPKSYIEAKSIINKNFNDGKTNEAVVQLRPQHIKMFMRPLYNLSFKFDYKPLKFYPLDMYYLADYSWSMKKYKDEFDKQSQMIYHDLMKLSDNVKMGLGSFVDKPALPYSSKYHLSYSFLNHLSLTSDTSDFLKKVNSTKIGGNIDSSEGGLDALLQVMLCTKEILWRNETTRLIIFTTDASYHSAGDGKMLGIIKPHDGQCHLAKNTDGEYTYSKQLQFDYPSVPLISKVAKDNNFIIIFATPSDVRETYVELSRFIPGAKHALLGEADKRTNVTVMDLITNEYEKMRLHFKFQVKNAPDYVEITFDPDCTKKEVPDACRIKNGGQVQVTAHIALKYCPSETNRVIEIKVFGNPETLTIDLHYLCNCISDKHNIENNSDKCNKHGDYMFGTCDCQENWYGPGCECSLSDLNISVEDHLKRCTMPNNTIDAVCLGRGHCKCGQCQCRHPYRGAYCECNDFSCRVTGKEDSMCSGERNGKCVCGKCECSSDFIGSDCSCTIRQDGCVDPLSNKVCSGNGLCECGRCICKSKPKQYLGEFCEHCQDCIDSENQCGRLQECVQKCSREMATYCNCSDPNPAQNYNYTTTTTKVDKFNEMSSKQMEEWRDAVTCPTLGSGATCSTLFKYKVVRESKTVEILIQKTLDCSKLHELLLYIMGLVGVLVLVPLVSLLAWKLITHIHDEREYNTFKREMEGADWADNDNPLYDQPTATYLNPAYGKE